jgi:hypothetical protein
MPPTTREIRLMVPVAMIKVLSLFHDPNATNIRQMKIKKTPIPMAIRPILVKYATFSLPSVVFVIIVLWARFRTSRRKVTGR